MDAAHLLSGLHPCMPWHAKIATAIVRIEQGNLSNAKPVGEGVLEYRIDFGPGYRVYFGRIGTDVVILLSGGTKKRQQGDIKAATQLWKAYKIDRRAGEG